MADMVEERYEQRSECQSEKQKDGRETLSTVPMAVLELEAGPKLQLTLRECRCEAQRRTGGDGRAAFNVEGCEPGGEPEVRADNVVHTGIVGAIGKVETFSDKLQVPAFAQLEPTHYAHVKGHEIRPLPGVAGGAERTVVGAMTVSVNISPGQKVKGMAA